MSPGLHATPAIDFGASGTSFSSVTTPASGVPFSSGCEASFFAGQAASKPTVSSATVLMRRILAWFAGRRNLPLGDPRLELCRVRLQLLPPRLVHDRQPVLLGA